MGIQNKFIYNITEKGTDLIPVIVELMIWGTKYNPPGADKIVKELDKDKEGTIRHYREKLLQRLKDKAAHQQLK